MITVITVMFYVLCVCQVYIVSVAAAAVLGTFVGHRQSKRRIALAALSGELTTIAALRARKRFLDSMTWWDMAPWRLFRYYRVLEEISCIYNEAFQMGEFWSPPPGDE